MYYFEKIDFEKSKRCATFGGALEDGFNCGRDLWREDLAEIFKLAAKFKHQLFDDYSFLIGTKSTMQASFECAMRMIEIICEGGGDFYLIKCESGEIAGFWYLYDINYARFLRRGCEEFEGGEAKVPVSGCFAGCMKKKFWGADVRKIMKKVLDEIFEARKFRKIKCETFSTNPYIEGLLKKFNFRCEGILKNETVSAGRACDVKIWALERSNWEQNLYFEQFEGRF